MVRGGRLKERDPLFEIVLKWITHSEVMTADVLMSRIQSVLFLPSLMDDG
jgi:hypothetical protein